MNKSELIAKISDKTDLTKAQIDAALTAFTETVTESLTAGEPVVLVGFGTFQTGDRAARTGRNPQTGAPISIAAAKVPSFKAGKSLKDAVNS